MRNPFKRRQTDETQWERWELKQRAAAPGRYYGDGGTIHRTNHLDVETCNGRVVAVWFRCQMLPFAQVSVDDEDARTYGEDPPVLPLITGVEVVDPIG